VKVYRIAHAGLLVETAEATCLMDPVFFQPFEGDVNVFEPVTSVTTEDINDYFSLVVISHEHMDHFDIPSLNVIDRRCPIVYPRGAALIEPALKAMGFAELRPVAIGETLTIGDMSLHFTGSTSRVREMGVLFKSAGRAFWNAVDTGIDEAIMSAVLHRVERLDLMFAHYVPLLEGPLTVDALGTPFPYDAYSRKLRTVTTLNPRFVVPASCGYRYCHAEWMNNRGFPVSDEEFVADIENLGHRAAVLPNGAAITVDDGFTIERDALPFVRQHHDHPPSKRIWRPDRGIPELKDDNSFEYDVRDLRRNIDTHLGAVLQREAESSHLSAWRRRMEGVVWQLDIVYPDGTTETKFMTFAPAGLSWSQTRPGRVGITTAVPASILWGLIVGDVNGYRGYLARRVFTRLYRPSGLALERLGSESDEPLARLILPSSDWRFLGRQLETLGFHLSGTVRESANLLQDCPA
jgi:UDP-MurNAc hydroxylase